MKVKSFIIAVFVLAFMSTNAQNTLPFAKGNNVLCLGIGLGSTLYNGVGYTSSVPPISISLDHIMADGLLDGKAGWGIGGYIGYTSAKWEYTYTDPFTPSNNYTYGWKYTSLIIGPRGTFHYNFLPKFDTYAGVLLGFNYVTSKETGNWQYIGNYGQKASSSDLAYSVFIGGRYYFTNNFAVMAELGYGISYLNLGIALKM